jgi:hypothetical protein
MKKIAVLYPRVPHYRETFFKKLGEKYDLDIYVYEDDKKVKKQFFNNANIKTYKLFSFDIFSKLRFVNPIPFFSNKYDTYILIGEIRNITVWLILVFAKLSGKKTILWGHGISVHNYLQEEKKLNFFRVFFNKTSDMLWLYTKKEQDIWNRYLPIDKLTYLNNTVDTESILEIPIKDKIELKEKYNIKTSVNLIFSARFITKERRTDLLLEVMDKLDKKKYGLIIIGDGPLKPNFSEYTNIYDFGLVYDIQIKSDLFQIADLYFQPGWLGLSCNEALAQAKGVLTFKRSDKVKQCVEYGYLNKDFSFIAENVEEMVDFLEHINDSIIQEFSVNARNYAKTNLLMSQMVKNADESLRRLIK